MEHFGPACGTTILLTQRMVLFWDFPGDPVVKPALPLQGAWVLSLVRKGGSCRPSGLAKKKKKEVDETLYLKKIILFLFDFTTLCEGLMQCPF